MSSYTDTMLKLERMTQSTNAQQMAWQEKMSGQSHQLEVADLIKAGLNPVLSSGGNGAQSYTTSLDSGASAIANTYAAKESSAATRYAARQSAAATRAAAYAQLEAARLGYNASIYGTDAQERMNTANNQNRLEVLDKTPPQKLTELVWKLADQSGIRKELMKSNIAKGLTSSVSLISNNPANFFRKVKGDYITDKNFILNTKGIKAVNKQLSKLGVKNIGSNQRLFIKAFVFGDLKALYKLASKIPKTSSAVPLGRMVK